MIGKSIGHYTIFEQIGQGGMGIVYKAQDAKLDRVVALKFLPQHLTSEETERARFLQEAKAAATLNHPNICTVYGIEEADGQLFIDMEYVDGVTLREKTPVEKLDAALAYALQIGEALEEAHAHGVVHRDVKAENIMVNAKNQIKVMDFGLAKLKGSLKLTRTSSTVGTLSYMAPEQIQGGEVDARSDIFSFGIVLYEMLSGKLPFNGEHEAAMMYCILNEEPEPITKYRTDLPAELLHILDRSMEKDPAERYQSIADMLIDLRRVKKQSTKVTRSAVHQVPQQSGAMATPAAPAPTPAKKRGLAFAGLGVVVIAAIVLWRIFSSGTGGGGPHPFTSVKPTRVATDAQPINAALSPDGKYIIYAVDESGKRSVWMRQVSASSSVRILPGDDVQYQGFTFAPDGNTVYYSYVSASESRGAVSVVPTLGGTPRKIISNIVGGVSISPDGRQIAFFRTYPDNGEEALMLCAADGSNERKLLSRTGEDFFLGSGGQAPSWSPDGATLAVQAGTTAGKIHMSVALVSAATGKIEKLYPTRWENMGCMVWVDGGKGLVLAGTEYMTGVSVQLWYLNIADGSVSRVTSDLADYSSSSLGCTSDQKTLLCLQQSFSSAMEVLPGGDSRRARRLSARNAYRDGNFGTDWTPDGRIVFSSIINGNPDLWVTSADGKDRRQLTSSPVAENNPGVSSDGKLIAYASNADSTPHIWVMDIDGGNQRRLTTGGMDDYLPRFMPGSHWIFFDSYRDRGRRNCWKVDASGGEPVKVLNDYVYSGQISADGTMMLGRTTQESTGKTVRAIYSLVTGKLERVLDLPLTASWDQMHWMPDGKGVAYVDTRNGISNIWVLPLSTLKAYQLTHYDADVIPTFSWSKDGKNLLVVRGEASSDIVLLNDVK